MSGFSLKSGDKSSDFANRCNDVFAALDSHAPKSQPEPEVRAPPSRDDRSPRIERESSRTSDYRGRESIFRVKDSDGFSIPRRPDLPRFQRGGRGAGHRMPSRTPDHMTNPRKYVKYSLADVEELSDRGNARAAFDFLRQRAQVRESESGPALSESDEPAKITFKRPNKKADAADEDQSEAAPKFSGGAGGFGKRVLPECVVGGSAPKFGRRRQMVKTVSVDEGDAETEATSSSAAADRRQSSDESAPKRKKSKMSSTLSFEFDDDE